MSASRPVQVLDAAAGYAPVTNLLAVGDPDVRWLEDRWVMYVGAAFTEGGDGPAGVNLYAAELPPGAPLTADDAWRFVTEPDDPSRARPLVGLPGPGVFDEWLHTPCRVTGRVPGSEVSVVRLYYTGTAGEDSDASARRMTIGVLELHEGAWRRTGEPVVTGDDTRGAVLEPKVLYADGRWRMWFQATDHEAGPGELPDCEIRYTESADGLGGWSEPRTVFASDADHNFFDAAPTALPDGRHHLLAPRAPNLFTPVEGLSPQGLWSFVSDRPSGDRADWTPAPRRLLDADAGERWFAGGVYGPCAVVDDSGPEPVLQVFFTGSAPPEPRPYVLSVGRLPVPLARL